MQRKQKLSLEFNTPSHAYYLKFSSVYEGKDKIIAVLTLHRIDGGGEAIKRVSDSLEIDQKSMHLKPVQYYVLTSSESASSWWPTNKNFTIITDINQIQNQTSGLQKIYDNPNPFIDLGNRFQF